MNYLLYGSERYALAILRPLQQELRRRGHQVAWFFDGPGSEDLLDDERLLRDTAEVRRFAPVAVLTSSNAVPHFFPGLKIEVFHGFDAGKPRHIYIRGFFDVYCTTGPQDTEAFSALARQLGHFRVIETGWPKLDPLFAGRVDPPAAPDRDRRPCVLYHSTFSPSWSAARILHSTVRELVAEDRWDWIVTLHPKSAAETVALYRALECKNLRFSEDDNIVNELRRADVMVSDTSSALNEFLVSGKPVVTFRNRRPGPQLIDIDRPEDLKPALERALAYPPDLMAAIRDFGQRLHPYTDGGSSGRVVDAVEAMLRDGLQLPRRKPLNLWRKLKIRKRIGYWGP